MGYKINSSKDLTVRHNLTFNLISASFFVKDSAVGKCKKKQIAQDQGQI